MCWKFCGFSNRQSYRVVGRIMYWMKLVCVINLHIYFIHAQLAFCSGAPRGGGLQMLTPRPEARVVEDRISLVYNWKSSIHTHTHFWLTFKSLITFRKRKRIIFSKQLIRKIWDPTHFSKCLKSEKIMIVKYLQKFLEQNSVYRQVPMLTFKNVFKTLKSF